MVTGDFKTVSLCGLITAQAYTFFTISVKSDQFSTL